MPEAPHCMSTFWLTCATIAPGAGVDRDVLIDRLAHEDIEARPAWKPMHLQPIFAGARTIGGTVAERLFAEGICLPSGSNLTASDRERVVETIHRAYADATP
ncbi:hypothetical protein BH11MYX3_BH11MYX3_47370 [soil metagenome]